MIQELYSNQFPTLREATCKLYVFPAWRRVSRWVIVNENDCYGSVAQRLKSREIEKAAIALHRVHKTENAIETLAVLRRRFPRDDFAAEGFEHFPAFRHEIGNEVVHPWPR